MKRLFLTLNILFQPLRRGNTMKKRFLIAVLALFVAAQTYTNSLVYADTADTVVNMIQGLIGSIAIKAPVVVVSTTNLTLSGQQTVDGVALVEGDRILVAGQTNGADNGIYSVSTGTWQRTRDFDGARDATYGTVVGMQEGTYQSCTWQLQTADPTIGTDSLSWTIHSCANAIVVNNEVRSACETGTSTYQDGTGTCDDFSTYSITCTNTNVLGTNCGSTHDLTTGFMVQIASGTVILPAVASCAGCGGCVKATTAAVIYVDPNANDRFVLDGVALADGDKLQSLGDLDDTICFYNDSAAGWTTIHNPDVFSDGN
jgi:hypothetical protein